MTSAPQPPPGFVLEKPKTVAPPPGFVVQPAPKGDKLATDPMFPRATGGPLPPAQGKGTGANYPPWSGGVLPLSSDQTGAIKFDPQAGLLGALVNATSLPGDVYAGRTDPQSNEGISRALSLALVSSPVNPGVRAGDAWLPGPRRVGKQPDVPAPTSDELYGAADNGYNKARGLGVVYTADSVVNAIGTAQAGLERKGIIAENAPQTFAILKKLQSPPAGADAPYTGLEAARQALNNVRRDNPGKTEAAAATQAIDALDGFFASPDPASVVAGDASAIATIAKEARGNYAAASRSDRIQGIEDAAGLRAKAANSGFNADNAIRSRVVSLLLNPKQLQGYSADEVAALRQVAEGTASRNTVRWVGNLLGGGGGLGAALTGMGGAALGNMVEPGMGGIAGAGIGPAVGASARTAANWWTRRTLNKADEMVRTRSPLHDALVANAPPEISSPLTRTGAPRAFVAGELNDMDARRKQKLIDALIGQQTVY